MQDGAYQILEYPVDANAPAANHQLREIDLPLESNLIAILRGNLTVVPRGDTRLQEGDVIVALVQSEQEAQLRTALLGA